MSKSEDLSSDLAKREEEASKRVEKLRQDVKAKDEQIRDLEDQVPNTAFSVSFFNFTKAISW